MPSDRDREQRFMNQTIDSIAKRAIDAYGEAVFAKKAVVTKINDTYRYPADHDPQTVIVWRAFFDGRVSHVLRSAKNAQGIRIFESWDGQGKWRIARSFSLERAIAKRDNYANQRDALNVRWDIWDQVVEEAGQLQLPLDADIAPAWDAVMYRLGKKAA